MKDDLSYKHCLNCNTELHGKFCHVCGQQATSAKPTIKEFILEYLNIAFIWDAHFIKTLKTLICKPGFLTNEYISGKFVSYTHPLKLNMFLLFVFITIFLISPHADNLSTSLQTVTRDEVMSPMIRIQIMTDDEEYSMELKSSPRDTVYLYSPYLLFETFPEFFENLDEASPSTNDSLAVWTTVLPQKLIEDKVILPDEKGYYYFNLEETNSPANLALLENVWNQMIRLATKYFIIIILLTIPFLSFVLGLLLRKGNHSKFKHLIFSLHYTALLELLIIFLYLIHLIASPPSWIMQTLLISVSFTYLTFAVRKTYQISRWYQAVSLAIFTNLGYSLILMAIFIIILLISTTIVAIQMT